MDRPTSRPYSLMYRQTISQQSIVTHFRNMFCKYACFNSNSLHYYVPRVPRQADRWRQCDLFSIFWNLIQVLDAQFTDTSCTSPSKPQGLKLSNENCEPRRVSNPGCAEPKAGMLPCEPAQRFILLCKCLFRFIAAF